MNLHCNNEITLTKGIYVLFHESYIHYSNILCAAIFG